MSLYGVVLSLLGIRDANYDRRALGIGNGRLRELVATRRRREVIRLLAQLLFLSVGVLALIPGTSEVERIWSTAALFFGAASFVANSHLDRRDRENIRRL